VIFIPLTVVRISVAVVLKELKMAEQLRRPFEKLVDSPYSEKTPSQHLRVGTLWRCGDSLVFE
jgi:hypothetical protein